MSFFIVPNYIHDQINEMLDVALTDYPGAAPDREQLYSVLLTYVDKHGILPKSFKLEPKP
jgi:hypothetical protein